MVKMVNSKSITAIYWIKITRTLWSLIALNFKDPSMMSEAPMRVEIDNKPLYPMRISLSVRLWIPYNVTLLYFMKCA
jgi:hypothetical protein